MNERKYQTSGLLQPPAACSLDLIALDLIALDLIALDLAALDLAALDLAALDNAAPLGDDQSSCKVRTSDF